MPMLKQDRLIMSSAAKVWAALTAPEEIPQWANYVTRVEYEGPPGEGTIRKMIAPKTSYEEQITLWRQQRELSVKRIRSPRSFLNLQKTNYFHETWILDPIETDKTILTWKVVYKATGTLGLMLEQTLSRHSIANRIKENLLRLKDYLEYP
ncbi:MAG: SRPBCC family protein [Candidatus Ranarchaeia archaeon]